MFTNLFSWTRRPKCNPSFNYLLNSIGHKFNYLLTSDGPVVMVLARFFIMHLLGISIMFLFVPVGLSVYVHVCLPVSHYLQNAIPLLKLLMYNFKYRSNNKRL